MAAFLSHQNAQMLWEVLIDNETIAKNKHTQEVFTKVLPEFYEREKLGASSLIELNKGFISLMMKLLTAPQSPQQPQKKELITFEDLQTQRTTLFEEELSRKQSEFTSAMSLPVPETPQFADSAKDQPLSEMEMIIKRTIAERNLDLEQIHNTSNKKSEAEKWLQSTNTSVKEEKLQKNDFTIQALDLTEKHITWAEPQEEPDTNVTTNIFSRLKPAPDLLTIINERFDRLEKLIAEKNEMIYVKQPE